MYFKFNCEKPTIKKGYAEEKPLRFDFNMSQRKTSEV
jgi:hypothetical protein